MLQKLENLYLAILRFVVILVAGLLLAAVIMFGLASFRALQSPPQNMPAKPLVSDAAVKKAVLEIGQSIDSTPSVSSPEETLDPEQQFYDRASVAIADFVTANAVGEETVDAEQVANILKDRADKYSKQGLTGAFAKNFAESVERLLKDPAIVAFAQKSSSLKTVNHILGVFVEQFNEQIEKTNAENMERQREHLEMQANGQQNIYMAAGSFGAFLMIVFLSIIIRIERNLRHLEKAAT